MKTSTWVGKQGRTTVKVIAGLALLSVVPAMQVGCSSTATRQSTGEYIDDAVITAKVKTALARDDQVNAFAVKVETYRGVVQLSGFVDTAEEKRQAALDAQAVAGVLDVQNNISIKPPPESDQ